MILDWNQQQFIPLGSTSMNKEILPMGKEEGTPGKKRHYLPLVMVPRVAQSEGSTIIIHRAPIMACELSLLSQLTS